MLRSFKTALAVTTIAVMSQQALAQDFAESMQQMGADAVKGYMAPFATGVGSGMNSQWSYTSKAQSFKGLPVGFNIYFGVPIKIISKSEKTFDFTGSLPTGALLDQIGLPAGLTLDSLQKVVPGGQTLDLKTLHVVAKDVPTFYGSSKAKKAAIDSVLPNSDFLTLVRDYNKMIDSTNALASPSAQQKKIAIPDSIELPFVGVDFPIGFTLPNIGASICLSKIPVLDNITLGGRFIPTTSLYGIKAGLFGFTVQHEITPHIPVLSSLPFIHLGTYYGYNSFTIEGTRKDTTVTPNTKTKIASLNSINQIGMLTFSLDPSIPVLSAGIYGGIGFEKSSLTVDVSKQELANNLELPAFKVTIDGKNFLRTQIGARVSLGAVDIFADANFGSATIYNAGIAIGLNGL